MPGFWKPRLGAVYLGNGRGRFRVWASKHEAVELHLTAPEDRVVPMRPQGAGYFEVTLDGVPPGARYLYRLGGEVERPDPASRSQPTTVHEPSEVVGAAFDWTDRHWHGLPLDKYVIYELHVGTFTPEGTFDAVIPYLAELAELGVTAVELMPVAQFAGGRGWGYDGVYPFAPQNSYGGPAGLKRLVDACHAHGLAVVLDVVYNHFGPEGGYLHEFAHYFTDRYRTPWGGGGQLRRPQERRGPAVLHRERPVLGPRVPRRRPAARRRPRHPRRDRRPVPAGTAAVGPAVRHGPQPAGLPDRRERPERRPGDPPPGPRRAGPRRPVGRRLPPLRVHPADRRGEPVPAGLRPVRPAGQRLAARVRVHRPVLPEPGAAARERAGRPAGPAVRRVHPEPRPDRQPEVRRAVRGAGDVRGPEARRRDGAPGPVPADAVHGRGVRRGRPVPVLHRLLRPRAGGRGAGGAQARVRDGRRGRPAGPAGRGDVPPLEARPRAAAPRQAPGALGLLPRVAAAAPREPGAAVPGQGADAGEPFPEHRTLLVERWDGDDETLVGMNFGGEPAPVRITLRAGTWARQLDSADPRWAGPGTPSPAELRAHSEVRLTLAPTCVVVYALQTEPVTSR